MVLMTDLKGLLWLTGLSACTLISSVYRRRMLHLMVSFRASLGILVFSLLPHLFLTSGVEQPYLWETFLQSHRLSEMTRVDSCRSRSPLRTTNFALSLCIRQTRTRHVTPFCLLFVILSTLLVLHSFAGTLMRCLIQLSTESIEHLWPALLRHPHLGKVLRRCNRCLMQPKPFLFGAQGIPPRLSIRGITHLGWFR